jgi:hypothetical protein
MAIGRAHVLASARGIAVLIAALLALALAPSHTQAQFRLGLQDPGLQSTATAAQSNDAFSATRAIHGSLVRVAVLWSQVAPGGLKRPTGFDAANPADPQYRWSALDATVRIAAQHHLSVVFDILHAPAWAEGPGEPSNPASHSIDPGAWDPSPSDLGEFARAAGMRYSGSFPDPLHPGSTLPRVKYWEIWNEENLPFYLAANDLVDEYRSLLNAGYAAVKSVNPNNVVILGGLAPVSFLPPYSMSPLTFAADLLCLHRVGTQFHLDATCPRHAHFDVFAHHPYTLAATPTKPAYNYDDVLVADMGKIANLIHTADRLHTDAPAIRHRIWVTEWSWFTNPPNTQVGDSPSVAARYVAYSMYEMWKNGVSAVIWQAVRDSPTANPIGGGLYTSSGQPKLTLRAFAFPVVASVAGSRGFVWGRVPVSHRVRVFVQRAVGHRWRRVATTMSRRDGVFSVRIRAHRNGLYRATAHHLVSLAYNSKPIPPKRTHLFNSG